VVPAVVFAALAASGLAACGDDDGGGGSGSGGQSGGAKASDVVTIEMSDFAYSVSGPLITGGTLQIRNTGQEFHMLGIGRLKPGKTLADLTKALSEAGGPPGGGEAGGPSTTATGSATTATTRAGATTSASTTTSAAGGQGGGGQGQDPTADIIDDVGFPGNFMSPGESVELRVPNLTPGTYALVCFIPSEGDAAPHFVKGMVNQLDVVAGTAPSEPSADATYRLAPGQPVQGPTTLTAGKHTLRFEAAPGSDQLEPTLARINSGTTFTQLDEAFVRLFESNDPPPRGAARQAPGQVVFGGFDLGGVTTFTLTVDLKAGNYVIVAEDTDADNRSRPPREIINIRVS
jgi:hypothetical protein